MNCKNCSEIVSSKFKYALISNSCPFCGGQIMDEELKIILNNLSEIMKSAEPYQEQVEDWLATNYNLGKKSSKSQFYEGTKLTDNIAPKQIKETNLLSTDDFDEGILQQQIAMAKAKTAAFQQKNQVKFQDAKSLISKIQNGGAADPSEFVGEDPDYGPIDLSKENESPLAPNEAAQMVDLFDNDYSNSKLEEMAEFQKIKKLHASQKSKIARRDD